MSLATTDMYSNMLRQARLRVQVAKMELDKAQRAEAQMMLAMRQAEEEERRVEQLLQRAIGRAVAAPATVSGGLGFVAPRAVEEEFEMI